MRVYVYIYTYLYINLFFGLPVLYPFYPPYRQTPAMPTSKPSGQGFREARWGEQGAVAVAQAVAFQFVLDGGWGPWGECSHFSETLKKKHPAFLKNIVRIEWKWWICGVFTLKNWSGWDSSCQNRWTVAWLPLLGWLWSFIPSTWKMKMHKNTKGNFNGKHDDKSW